MHTRWLRTWWYLRVGLQMLTKSKERFDKIVAEASHDVRHNLIRVTKFQAGQNCKVLLPLSIISNGICSLCGIKGFTQFWSLNHPLQSLFKKSVLTTFLLYTICRSLVKASIEGFNGTHCQHSKTCSFLYNSCVKMLSSTDMVVRQMDVECRPAMGSPWNKLPPICSACCQRDSQGLHLCTSCWDDPSQANNWYPYLWGMPDSFPCLFFPVHFKFQPVYWVWYIRLAPGINTGIITGSKDPTRLVWPEAIPGSISGPVKGITTRRAPNKVGAKPGPASGNSLDWGPYWT
jgi:hypothetical protein